jgi:hypothetical protein
MTFTKNTVRMALCALALSSTMVTTSPQIERMQHERMFNIEFLRSLKDQAIVDVHHAAVEISEKLNKGLAEVTTTPEIPSATAIATDKFIDFYFQTNRKHWYTKAPEYGAKWLFTGILPGLAAGVIKIFSKKPNPPRTLPEKISIAMYSSLIYGAQEFIAAKTGLNKVTALTVGDFLDAIKDAAIKIDLKLTPEQVSTVATVAAEKFKTKAPAEDTTATTELQEQLAELKKELAELRAASKTT